MLEMPNKCKQVAAAAVLVAVMIPGLFANPAYAQGNGSSEPNKGKVVRGRGNREMTPEEKEAARKVAEAFKTLRMGGSRPKK